MLDVEGHVKLVDFGFAKYLHTERTWTMCGTPDYIAPEVISGEGHGYAVDFWSLGVLLYEMLVGYPPFSDESIMGLFGKIRNPRAHLHLPDFLSNDAKDLLQRLLEVDPTRRLGCGTEDPKQHPWFGNVDWEQVASRQNNASQGLLGS